SDTLFLPNSHLAYQLTWHHGAARIIGALPETLTRYHQVMGVGLATGWLLLSLILWILFYLRPGLLLKAPFLMLFTIVLLLADGEVFGFVTDMITQTFPDTDLEHELPPRYFQYFSLFLAVVSAPQHTMFLILALATIFTRCFALPTN